MARRRPLLTIVVDSLSKEIVDKYGMRNVKKLMNDGVDATYSVAGDHGGIQRAAQQIPIVFAGADLSNQDLWSEVRSVDIMPTILKAMGIRPTYPMDGYAYSLPTKRND